MDGGAFIAILIGAFEGFVFHKSHKMKFGLCSEKAVKIVLAKPEQVEMVSKGRAVYQSRLEMGEPPKTYLLRVFVDVDPRPPYVVTVYRTSKIEKYQWITKIPRTA